MTEHQRNHRGKICGHSLKAMAFLGMEKLRNALSPQSSFPRHSSEPGMRDHQRHRDVADRSNSASQERKPRLPEMTHTGGNGSRWSRAGVTRTTGTQKGVVSMLGFLIVICLIAYGLHQLTQFTKNNPAQSMDIARLIKRMFDK